MTIQEEENLKDELSKLRKKVFLMEFDMAAFEEEAKPNNEAIIRKLKKKVFFLEELNDIFIDFIDKKNLDISFIVFASERIIKLKDKYRD